MSRHQEPGEQDAHADDVALARACLDGDQKAVQELARLVDLNLGRFIARIDRSPTFADDLRQHLLERLLDKQQPRLASYSGSGPLLGWLRIVAIRMALDAKRAAREPRALSDVDIAAGLARGSADPELDLFRTQYRDAFESGLKSGVERLTSRQRGVLRLYLLGGLNIDEIGNVYRVHRSTVARWISSAEHEVYEVARSYLAERHGLAPADLNSLIGLLRSQLQLSLDRLLRP